MTVDVVIQQVNQMEHIVICPKNIC